MSKRAGLRDSTIKLVAGAPEDIPADGNYLRISAANYAVIVEVGGNDVYKLNPGQDVTYPIDEGFTRIRLSTLAPVDDLVTVTVGNNVKVGSVVLAGQVSIAGVASVSGVVDVSGDYTIAYKVIDVSTSTNQIVAPAANVNGLILQTAEISQSMNVSGGTGYFAFVAKAGAAPANPGDGDMILGVRQSGPDGTGVTKYIAEASLMKAVKIPAGMGLYYVGQSTSNTGIATALVKVL